VVLTQWAANPEKLACPIPAAQCRWPVTFLGMAYGNRPKWIARLKQRGIDVNCFGYGWENGAVDADDIPHIARNSVISLNFGDSDWVLKGMLPRRNRQVKARIFEVPGYGGFLLSQPAENLSRYYRIGEEIVLFENIQDLIEKITHFLTHPHLRDEIARAAHARTRAEHTYDQRLSSLLGRAQKLMAGQTEKGLKIKDSNTINMNCLQKLESAHAPSPLLYVLKYFLLLPCTAIWGRKRGPRAARRILFEIYWRIAGKKTYSVTGWPGRIFYKES
jgi:spore maturation protein CgeB